METVWKCEKCGTYFKESDAGEAEVDLEDENGVGNLFPSYTHHLARVMVCPSCGSEDIDEDICDEDDAVDALNGYVDALNGYKDLVKKLTKQKEGK